MSEVRSSRYKWVLIALLSGAFFFHQADRALFGLLTVPIQADLGLTDIQIGWINTTLSWTLALMTVVAGFAGDRLSRKWLITISLIAWSLMTVCMGFVGGFVGALFFRSVATGVGESFYAPSAYALIAAHHKETRSLALSIHQAALYFGLMVSGVLTAWALGLLGGWRHVFIAFGLAGALLGIVFIFALKDEPRAPRVETAKVPRMPLKESLSAYFRNPSALCATAGFVAIAFFFGGLSGIAMGALSHRWGVRGFELGFAIMAATYAVAAALMAISFFFTFKKNRVIES